MAAKKEHLANIRATVGLALLPLLLLILTMTTTTNAAQAIAKDKNPRPADPAGHTKSHHHKYVAFHQKSASHPEKNGPIAAAGTIRANVCHRLDKVMKRKDIIKSKLDTAVSSLRKDKSASQESVARQSEILEVFSRQLDSNEQIIYKTIDWLGDALKGNYKDFLAMKMSLESRLNTLRDMTFKEEQDYHKLVVAERERTKHFNHSHDGGILETILEEFSNAADDLEEGMEGHLFDKANGRDVEAVVRINPSEETVIRLVDANDNKFVLEKSQDSTVPHEDELLLLDIVYLMVLCTFLGYCCSLIYLPAMFGHVVGGIILGPSVLNILTSIVQIETLAEFGVFFIMFTVGLEFSPSHIKQVLRISLLGSFGITAVMIFIGLMITLVVQTSTFGEGAFIGACFSLSSTPLVVKFIAAPTLKHEYEDVLLGILVMQDVQMGLLIAFLPALSGKASMLNSAGIVVTVFISLVVVLSFSYFILTIIKLLRHRMLNLNSETITLGSCSLVFILLLFTHRLDISMELGCFLAGSIISASGEPLRGAVEVMASPIKDFFACLFFASIGLHVFPSFVVVELSILALATIIVVAVKFTTSVIVMGSSLALTMKKHKWIIAAGLSQVSEFSFVLGSRARHLGLISREIYLLILSLSTLSLVMAPVIWKTVMWDQSRSTRFRRQKSETSSVSSMSEHF